MDDVVGTNTWKEKLSNDTWCLQTVLIGSVGDVIYENSIIFIENSVLTMTSNIWFLLLFRKSRNKEFSRIS